MHYRMSVSIMVHAGDSKDEELGEDTMEDEIDDCHGQDHNNKGVMVT